MADAVEMKCDPCEKRFRIKSWTPDKDYNCPTCGDPLSVDGDELESEEQFEDEPAEAEEAEMVDEEEEAEEEAPPARRATARRGRGRRAGGSTARRRKGAAPKGRGKATGKKGKPKGERPNVEKQSAAERRIKGPDTFYNRNRRWLTPLIVLVILAGAGYAGFRIWERVTFHDRMVEQHQLGTAEEKAEALARLQSHLAANGYSKDQDPAREQECTKLLVGALDSENPAIYESGVLFMETADTDEKSDWILKGAPHIIRLLRDASNDEDNVRYIRILAKHRIAASTKVFGEKWEEASADLKRELIKAFSKIKTRESYLFLIPVALHEDEVEKFISSAVDDIRGGMFLDQTDVKVQSTAKTGATDADIAASVLLQHESAEERLLAAFELNMAKAKQKANDLLAAFGDKEPNVGFAAAYALARVEPRDMTKRVQKMLDEGNPAQRRSCAYFFGVQPDVINNRRSRFASIRNAFEKEQDNSARAAMLIAMGRTRDPRAVSFLVEALGREQDKEAAHRGLVVINKLEDKGMDAAAWADIVVEDDSTGEDE